MSPLTRIRLSELERYVADVEKRFSNYSQLQLLFMLAKDALDRRAKQHLRIDRKAAEEATG